MDAERGDHGSAHPRDARRRDRGRVVGPVRRHDAQPGGPTFVLARAVTYATLFIGLVLVFLPARVLSWSGIARPTHLGALEIAGIVLCLAGGVLALWCVLTFAFVGKGTPAPFDPPRRLVVSGPYRHVRNPMYLGAAVALGGAAIVYHSTALLGYLALFLIIAHLFVVWYEEPTLEGLFGDEYATYRSTVRRWLPVP